MLSLAMAIRIGPKEREEIVEAIIETEPQTDLREGKTQSREEWDLTNYPSSGPVWSWHCKGSSQDTQAYWRADRDQHMPVCHEAFGVVTTGGWVLPLKAHLTLTFAGQNSGGWQPETVDNGCLMIREDR